MKNNQEFEISGKTESKKPDQSSSNSKERVGRSRVFLSSIEDDLSCVVLEEEDETVKIRGIYDMNESTNYKVQRSLEF